MNMRDIYLKTVLVILLGSAAVQLGACEVVRKGILIHDEYVESGNVELLEEGIALLESSSIVLGRAYLGSLYTMKASVRQSAGSLFQAAAFLERGFSELDGAVKQEPRCEEIRLLRAINSIEVSSGSPFDRYGEAEEDISWLEANSSDLQGSSVLLWLRGELSYYQGNINEALDAWEAAYAADPQGEFGILADDRLWDFME